MSTKPRDEAFYRVPGSLVYHTWLDCPKLEQANEFEEIGEEAEHLRDMTEEPFEECHE